MIKSRSNRCGECPLAGEHKGGASTTPHCKTFRLCDVIDVSMIDNYPGHTVREYAEMQRSIALGTATAVESLPERLLQTARQEDFIALVASVHRGIFHQAFGEDAGRFRRPGEEVHVGHEKHAFKGVDGAQITGRLGAMWSERFRTLPPSEVRAFARWAARFLREFFVIHPFIDGNGRTAREFVVAAAWSVNLAIDWHLPLSSKRSDRTRDRNRYLQALQYAHKHLGLTAASHGLRNVDKEPFGPLSRWCEERIVSMGVMADEPWSGDELDALHRSLHKSGEREHAEIAVAAAQAKWLQQEEVLSLKLPFARSESRKRQRHR